MRPSAFLTLCLPPEEQGYVRSGPSSTISRPCPRLRLRAAQTRQILPDRPPASFVSPLGLFWSSRRLRGEHPGTSPCSLLKRL